MKLSDFDFSLPSSQIAQFPAAQRTASRLLHLHRQGGGREDRRFTDLPQLLRAGDLLVFNDTRVIPARLLGVKASGGRVEVVIDRLLPDNRVLAQVRASKSPKPGNKLLLEEVLEVTALGREGEMFLLQFATPEPLLPLLERHGRLPLPPYIERDPGTDDRDRYQTVYARQPGAVAAPTAGLHFDEPMLALLASQGVEMTHVTLHVGAGTFSPVRSEDITAHSLHKEWVEVSAATSQAVQRARQRGGRVIAVGTTSVRSLETAARASGEVQPFTGDTQLFIYPGYRFQAVDGLVTNFHLPKSSLLMLVCAFGGYGPVMDAYRHAVAQQYRFFSYGDAMLIF